MRTGGQPIVDRYLSGPAHNYPGSFSEVWDNSSIASDSLRRRHNSPFAIATSLKLNFGTIAWGGAEKTCLPMKSDRYPRSLYGYGQER